MSYSRGYLLGRFFALLARLDALESAPAQLYQQAVSAPPQILPKAMARAIELGKEQELFPLMQLLPLDAFEGGLNRREQGAFAIGYAHERSGFPLPLVDGEEDDADEQELTERYELRIDPQLKDWLKTNGGGSFIRSVLRAERARRSQAVTEKIY